MSLLDAFLLESYRVNVWLAVRADGISGSGSMADPYDASTAAKFDALMDGFDEYTRVNLGPGIFETLGYSDAASTAGWKPKEGMKIVGSGIDVTTLRLVESTEEHSQYYCVGHPLATTLDPGDQVDFFEISDLTIDCNLTSQTTVDAAYGAIRIKGNHSRIRRIKVINWGSLTTQKGCYVIAAVTADPLAAEPIIFDTVIDECLVINPSAQTVAGSPITALHIGGKGEATAQPEATGESAVIRNCFVDAAPLSILDREVRALSVNWCHGAIVEGNQIYNVRYGGPFQNVGSISEVIVRNNFYKNVVKGPFFDLGVLGPAFDLDTFGLSGGVATPVTTSAHFLKVGDRIKCTGLTGTSAVFFQVSEIVNATTFKFLTSATGSSSPEIKKVLGVDKLLVEGNTIELALLTGTDAFVPIGIHLEDQSLITSPPPFAHGQVIIRDNRIRYVDGLIDEDYTGYALKICGASSLIARNNVVEVTPANPLKNFRCGSVSYFNNTDPGGTLIQGFNEDTDKKYDELETEAEDAFVLALFNQR